MSMLWSQIYSNLYNYISKFLLIPKFPSLFQKDHHNNVFKMICVISSFFYNFTQSLNGSLSVNFKQLSCKIKVCIFIYYFNVICYSQSSCQTPRFS